SGARPTEPAAAPAAPPRARQPSPPPLPRNDRPPLGQEDRPDQWQARSARQPQVPMQDPQLPSTRERPVARRGADNNASEAPGVRGFRDITADADDLGRAAAQASRAARKTYANVPSPSPEFDRLEPVMEDRGFDSEAPYSYDESVAEAERYAPPQQPAQPRPRVAPERSGEPKRGTVFPFKS